MSGPDESNTEDESSCGECSEFVCGRWARVFGVGFGVVMAMLFGPGLWRHPDLGPRIVLMSLGFAIAILTCMLSMALVIAAGRMTLEWHRAGSELLVVQRLSVLGAPVTRDVVRLRYEQLPLRQEGKGGARRIYDALGGRVRLLCRTDDTATTLIEAANRLRDEGP